MSELDLQTIQDIQREGRIYEVGGTVRDRFLRERGGSAHYSPDRDYVVCGVPYERLASILRRHGRVDLVGQSFGVIKFTRPTDAGPVTSDITLPRTEFSIGAGHRDFSVTFDHTLPIEKDLLRRDFTVNAMAREVGTEEIIDPLGGMGDLEKRELKIVYPESFSDDPLRMLRAIQFAARFHFTIEPSTFRALCQSAPLIATVSVERIAEELNKLLTLSARPSEGFFLMRDTGLLENLLPELAACVGVEQPGGYHKYPVFEHILYTIDACRPDLRLRLAALFHDIRKPQHKRLVEDGATFYGHEIGGAKTAREVMKRLRYGTDLTDDVVTLVERHMFTTDVTEKGLRRLVRRVGIPLIFELLDLRRADVVAQGMGGKTDDVDRFEAEIRAELEKKPPFALCDLALNGSDIMAQFGIPPGPQVGNILAFLLEAALDDPAVNTKEKLSALVGDYLHEQRNEREKDTE